MCLMYKHVFGLGRSTVACALAFALGAIGCGGNAKAKATGNQELLACAGDRWPVKTASDGMASQVNTAPQPATVAALTALSAPSVTDLLAAQDRRIGPVELTTYRLTDVTLANYARSPDLDVSVHVTDSGTSSPEMFVELPDPSCVATSSPFYAQMAAARSAFEAQHPLSDQYTTVGTPFSVIGIGYWDVPHSSDQAPNGIEIHPVLGICFGQGCQP